MRFRKLETVLNTIVATAVLHNICKIHGDNEPPPLSQHEENEYNLALRIERETILNMQQRNAPGRRQPATIANEMLRNYFEQKAQ